MAAAVRLFGAQHTSHEANLGRLLGSKKAAGLRGSRWTEERYERGAGNTNNYKLEDLPCIGDG